MPFRIALPYRTPARVSARRGMIGAVADRRAEGREATMRQLFVQIAIRLTTAVCVAMLLIPLVGELVRRLGLEAGRLP